MQSVPILFRDQNWLVVDKPPGLSIHNHEGPINLMEALAEQLDIEPLFPVHRLDKETSGVQIFALNKETAQKLSTEFQSGRVRKVYLGLLKGNLQPENGRWDRPLTDKAEGRKLPQGMAKKRVPCCTEYRVLKQAAHVSLCEFLLLTGRQHQIRKHTALAGHPLIGDNRYGSPSVNKKIKELFGVDRMFLHCLEIEIAGQKLKSQNIPDFPMSL